MLFLTVILGKVVFVLNQVPRHEDVSWA